MDAGFTVVFYGSAIFSCKTAQLLRNAERPIALSPTNQGKHNDGRRIRAFALGNPWPRHSPYDQPTFWRLSAIISQCFKRDIIPAFKEVFKLGRLRLSFLNQRF